MVGISRRTEEEFQALLAPGESLLFARRQHWGLLVRPTATAAAALLFLFVVLIDLDARTAATRTPTFLLLAMLTVASWWLYRFLRWRRQWFLVTPRRLLFLQGLLDMDVQMMPLAKLTDMTYKSTVWGDLFGYGHFVVESAGQDQAMSWLRFIPDAHEARDQITNYLFGSFPTVVKPHDEAVFGARLLGPEDGGPGGGRWVEEPSGWDPTDPYGDALDEPRHAAYEEWHHADSPAHEIGDEPPRGPHVPHVAPPRRGRSRTLYSSEDLVRARRQADTGELPAIPVRVEARTRRATGGAPRSRPDDGSR